MEIRVTALLVALALPCASLAHAQTARPSQQNSFRIGTGGSALCQAQSRIGGPAMAGMFDRSWSLVCRDAASPIGQAFALRHGGPDVMSRINQARDQKVDCSPASSEKLPDVGAITVRKCRIEEGGASYRIASVDKGRFTYVVQGYEGYAGVLDLAMRSIVADRIVAGKIEIATLGATDAAAFARAEARSLDPALLLAEGYRRNHSGNYAEAAQFFDAMQTKLSDEGASAEQKAADRDQKHEALVNRALQLSNLGEFAQADALFVEAAAMPALDPIQLRLGRNLLAIHHLNQGDYSGAREILDAPLAQTKLPMQADGEFVITPAIAAEVNSDPAAAAAGLIGEEAVLTPAERVAILDAQAQGLRGSSLRLDGQAVAARRDLEGALARLVAIRGGRVTSIARLRAQMLGEVALTYEAEKNYAAAEARFRAALDLLGRQYPETVAVNGARARFAAFLVRRGRNDEALSLYRQIIASAVDSQSGLTGYANQIQPYFALLAQEIPQRPELTADLFLAGQTQIRPGAATTLEQLARSLASGSDTGARLFRQSLSLSRDIERGRIALAQLVNEPNAAPALVQQQRDALNTLEGQKTAALANLSAYPQFRAISRGTLSLAQLQTTLRTGEAYYKLTEVGDALYAVYADKSSATGYRLPITARDLAQAVSRIRTSISTIVSGTQATYPFDVKDARALYVALFAPVKDRLSNVRHLIFEPDGAMLELPPNLLIADQKGVDAYLTQRDKPGGDDFDFRGIDWLGRNHAVSTALSARSFRDARNAPPSTGTRAFIGFGDNAPPSPVMRAVYMRAAGGSALDCRWPINAWDRPISATELHDAARQFDSAGSVVTGTAFTDQAILGRNDLDQYRIIDFATHGLTVAPHPGCPAQPSLLTSFGPAGSDGLLSFSEIFNLKIDADLVILSACDTAAGASSAAVRAAGLNTGGGNALGGLVRAFIGAGGRLVVASHWPAPDDYNATKRLFNGVFSAPAHTSIAEAMRQAEVPLMDDAATSHPFYWAGFAIIGDGARPLDAER